MLLCMYIYVMMRIGGALTSYLNEQPLDRQSQCTRIPWSMLAKSKTEVRHWARNALALTVNQIYSASVRRPRVRRASAPMIDITRVQSQQGTSGIFMDGATYNASSVITEGRW